MTGAEVFGGDCARTVGPPHSGTVARGPDTHCVRTHTVSGPWHTLRHTQCVRTVAHTLLSATVHTVEYDPFIKSQLALRN